MKRIDYIFNELVSQIGQFCSLASSVEKDWTCDEFELSSLDVVEILMEMELILKVTIPDSFIDRWYDEGITIGQYATLLYELEK
jgi:acyl carrier protein